MTISGDFDKNVFINCPFDDDYKPLLRSILFTILYMGYNPRIGLERFDSGETRFHKICELIHECKYGIHDLSRIQASEEGEYYRLNMPFELGLDIGCRVFKGKEWASKQHLILEKEQFRYQKALSDLANSDIKAHQNKPREIIRQIRHWFVENNNIKAASPSTIWYNFNDFMKDFDDKRRQEGFNQDDIFNMPVREYTGYIKDWLKNTNEFLPESMTH